MTVLLMVAAIAGVHHHDGCTTLACERRVDGKEHAKTVHRWRRVVRPYNPWLMRTAWCESRLRWHIATGNGFYGGLQFTLSSWRVAGGYGYPHLATPLEQKYRGVRLRWIQGTGAWPVCG